MKTITAECLETSQNVESIPEFDIYVFRIDMLASIVTESIYVIDVAANRFCYVSPNDLFLCGHSVDDTLVLWSDFYNTATYRWKQMEIKPLTEHVKLCSYLPDKVITSQ